SLGYELRAVGLGARAAAQAGINPRTRIVLAMAIAGGFAGLAGMIQVSGVFHRVFDGFSAGYGFDAIAVALLGKNSPIGIVLAALGGVVSERSGVVNIALEGCMLVGAFFGVVAADRTHSVVLALAVAMGAGGILAAIHAVAAIHLRSDQIVSGMALNILALGLTSYLDYQFYGN